MDTSRFGQFVVCFMFLSSVGQALRCLKGLQNQGDPLPDRILQCPSSSAVCGRADFEFVPGLGLSSSFDCVERASCMPKNCASFAGFDRVPLSKCQFKCCDNDLCNNQTLANISHVGQLTTVPMPPIPEITTTSVSPRTTMTVMVEPAPSGIDAETATAANVPIPRPPGMVCLQGMKLQSGVMPTETLACISETQVCARADFETPSFSGVTSFFNCVERNNCTQSKCEEFLNVDGLATSTCEFKCCDIDLCNNQILANISHVGPLTTVPTPPIPETTTTSDTPRTTTTVMVDLPPPGIDAETATGANVPIPRPPGLVCLQGMKLPSGAIPTETLACISETQVCARADFETSIFPGVTSVFNCVERNNCTLSNCEEFLNLEGLTTSKCQFKCCDNNLCNNQTMSNISHAAALTIPQITHENRVGQALRCLKGLQNQGDPLLDRILQCPSSSAVCGRVDFEFVPGSGLSSSFDCVERASCMPKNCASFAGFDGVPLSTCQFKCCDNDLCNNQILANISHVEPLTTVPTPPIPETTTTSDSPRTTTMVEPPTSGIDAETATGTNVSIPKPSGMVCLQGLKFPSGAIPTETLACISETQVCARVNFETPSFRGVTSFFNCVERNNCTLSNCEEFLNLDGLTTSSCEFKCCSFDMCNNRSLNTTDWNPYPTTTVETDKTTLTETTTATATTPTTTPTSAPTTATLTTPLKTVPILSSRYETEITSVPIPKPSGMVCLQGLKFPSGAIPTETLVCISETQVCARADIETTFFPGVNVFFDCVVRNNCTLSNCEEFLNLDGLTTSSREYKCFSFDVCNNRILNTTDWNPYPTTTVETDTTTLTETTTATATTLATTPATTPTTATLTTPVKTVPILSSRYETEITSVPITRPPGMVCLQGMKLSSGAIPTETLACISETQVCARADFETTFYFGVMSFFKCVERNNCTQSKCEEHINMNGVTASSCEFKCCSFDMCNNRSLNTTDWNPYPTTTVETDTTTLKETTTTLTETTTTTTTTTATPTTVTLTTPVKTAPTLSSIYETETSVPVSPGLRCANDMIPDMSDETQNSKTCTSPTEVCIKADIKIAFLNSASTLFKCVESIDCMMLNCSSIVGMNGIALSACDFKCCSSDMCNNNTLSDITGINMDSTSTKKAEKPDKTSSTVKSPETTPESESPISQSTMQGEPQVTTKSSPASASPATTASLLNIQTTSSVCTSTTFSSTLTIAAVFGAIVAANFVQ